MKFLAVIDSFETVASSPAVDASTSSPAREEPISQGCEATRLFGVRYSKRKGLKSSCATKDFHVSAQSKLI